MVERIVSHLPFRTPLSSVLLVFFLFIIPFVPGNSHALIGIQEGDPPKEITLNDINGKPVSLTNHIGAKPVILVFWKLMRDKSFLDYSLDELIFLEQERQKYSKDTGLEVFSIYTPQDDKEIDEREITEVRNLITVNRITFPVLVDKGLVIFREYGVIALPSTVMIDRSGTIAFIYPSFPIAARQIFSERIKDLLGIISIAKKQEAARTEASSRSGRLYHYSLQMYKRGLLEQALSPLKKSIDLDPGRAPAHNLMGLILSQRGSADESAAAFAKAIELDNKNVPAHFNYGLLLFDNEKYEESAGYLEKAIAIDPNNSGAHFVLGLLYKQTGKTDLAFREFETAFEQFRKNSEGSVTGRTKSLVISALYALSDLHTMRGNDKEALSALRKAAEIALGIGENDMGSTGLLRSRDYMVYE